MLNELSSAQSHVLGNTAEVVFPQLRGKSISGKVDTGATTSSLHAEDIKCKDDVVTFRSPLLSPYSITLDLQKSQDVQSADGGSTRPVVKLTVTIDGVSLGEIDFNLNDRSDMDSPILIGQNILGLGIFTIDPTKEQAVAAVDSAEGAPTRESLIQAAVDVLTEQDVSFPELVNYMQMALFKSSQP